MWGKGCGLRMGSRPWVGGGHCPGSCSGWLSRSGWLPQFTSARTLQLFLGLCHLPSLFRVPLIPLGSLRDGDSSCRNWILTSLATQGKRIPRQMPYPATQFTRTQHMILALGLLWPKLEHPQDRLGLGEDYLSHGRVTSM